MNITAHSSNKPITIEVFFDPTGTKVYSKTVDSYDFYDILVGITTMSGEYTVEASSPYSITRTTLPQYSSMLFQKLRSEQQA